MDRALTARGFDAIALSGMARGASSPSRAHEISSSELFFSFLSLGLLLQIFVPVALTTGRQDRGILIDKRHRGRPDLKHVPKNRAPGSPKLVRKVL